MNEDSDSTILCASFSKNISKKGRTSFLQATGMQIGDVVGAFPIHTELGNDLPSDGRQENAPHSVSCCNDQPLFEIERDEATTTEYNLGDTCTLQPSTLPITGLPSSERGRKHA